MTLLSNGSPFITEMKTRSARHRNCYERQLNEFRNQLNQRAHEEIDRLCEAFYADPLLAPHLKPVADELRQYLDWLKWAGWLSTHLGPPFELHHPHDCERLSIALVTYLGARLIDDGIDGHAQYKRKRETLFGALQRCFPAVPEAALRCQSALIGFWILTYGLRRMWDSGLTVCAHNTTRLFQEIAPGVVAETLRHGAITPAQYSRIVARKAVCYDMILYENYLAPLDPAVRECAFSALRRTSEVAQYLNDIEDCEDDRQRGQVNLVGNRFQSGKAFWRRCLRLAELGFAATQPLPDSMRDAFAAMIEEVFRSAAELWAPDPVMNR